MKDEALGMPSAVHRGAKALAALLAVLYPGFVYFGLQRWAPRVLAGVLLLLLLPSLVLRLAGARRQAWRGLAVLPLITGCALLLAVYLNSKGFVLLVPVVISTGFLASFAATLRRGPPMVERFARLQHSDLTPQELGWCRLWTQLWCVFFVFNSLITLALGQWASVSFWTTYTGLIAYLLMGAMFGVEYTVRKYRFGRLENHWLDRQLGRTYAAWGRTQ